MSLLWARRGEIGPVDFISGLKISCCKNHDFAMIFQEIRSWRTRRGEIDPLDFISDLKTSSCKNHDLSMFLQEIDPLDFLSCL